MNEKELEAALNFSIELSQKAGKLLLKFQKKIGELKINYKESEGVASLADFESEKLIIKSILKSYPETQILAEESSFIANIKNFKEIEKYPYTWIIDPLDGTTNFLNNFDYYSVCISLAHFGKPILGVVYRPSNGDLFYATKGKGAWFKPLGQKRAKALIPMKKKKYLKDALLITGFSSEKGQVFQKEFKIFKNLTGKCRGVRRLGSAALDMCYVSSGIFDGFWESKLAPWDVAASGLISMESGLTVKDLKGKDFTPFNDSFVVARAPLLKELLKALSN